MNTFGRLFKVTIYGESHGSGIGIVIDGCPPGIHFKPNDFIFDMERRRSGKKGTTERTEDDLPELISGVYKDHTTGAPLHIAIKNKNIRSSDYDNLINTPRPGHADYTGSLKYKGFNDPRGGGHFSGRLTAGVVAAGVIAKKIIHPMSPEANIISLAGQKDSFESVIDKAVEEGDSIGGIIQCTVKNTFQGLGEPFFDSIESVISHAVFSIPGIKGIEFGSGFSMTELKGSQANDCFLNTHGKTGTNHSGGINGGITNGNDIVFKVAVRPTASISLPQKTINLKSGKVETLRITGRHDACITLRIPVVVEAVTAISLVDLLLCHKKWS